MKSVRKKNKIYRKFIRAKCDKGKTALQNQFKTKT